MSNQEIKDERILRYLLGELEDSEQEELENACFADDDFFERVAAAETELIDSYVQGNLPANLRPRFESRYMRSPDQVRRIEFARRLLRETPTVEPKALEQTGFWNGLSLLRGFRKPVFAVPLAIAAVALAVFWVTHFPDRNESARLQPTPAQAPGNSATVPAPPAPVQEAGVVALTLIPGLTRSEGNSAALTLSPSDKLVRLTLEYEGNDLPAYRATIRTPEFRDVWQESGLKPAQPGDGKVTVSVPADRLRAGDYLVTLAAAPASGAYEDIAVYAFRVARR